MSDFNLPPTDMTPHQLYALLLAIDAKQGQLVREQVLIRERVEAVEVDTADLLSAWRAGGTLLRAAKLLSAIAAACIAVWAFVVARVG